VTSLQKVIPDTLTSWFISGYALSPLNGIGVSTKPRVLEAFRPFFISLNLPYSVVKGEVFPLQVLVHNYISSEVTAEVTLQNAAGSFEFQEEDNKVKASSTKAIKIGPNEVKSLPFVIKPVKFGKVSLDVKAVTMGSGAEQAGDAVSRPLLVKPPGQKQSMNKAVLVDLRSKTSDEQTLEANFPPERVEGADSVKVSVISDLLGSTISNLDKLLKMPTGCGEQNMVYFVPDIVILQYLESSGTLTPKIKAKALKFLESGYQRQLTYRHSDGSFSAFGKHDAHGSTWLTAFVVRSFVAAKPYITIDDTVITDALRFLQGNQQSDGSFVEHGTVFQNELKGGAVESLSLSTYVTLAFVESSKSFDDTTLANISDVTTKGLDFITKAPFDLDNPYAASLITYTLKVAGNEKSNIFKGILEKLAKRDGDLKYWEPKKIEIPANETLYRPWVPRTKPVSVEMTSYALLTYLLDGELENALPVGKWLLAQRSEKGGFISTQDTVVGLTALAKFAMTTKSTTSNLVIKVTHVEESQEFKVTKENEIVLQEAVLPPTTRTVSLESKGTGTALAQLTWSYYVEEKSEEPAFGLDINVIN
jgi:CD109 antigen